MKEVEEIAVKVREGKMTAQEGGRALMASVFLNKGFFGLSALGEDELMDFLEFELKSFERIFSIYDPTKASFTSFLYGNITRNLSNWRRKKYIHKFVDQTLVLSEISSYPEKENQFENDEAKERLEEESESNTQYKIYRQIQGNLQSKKYSDMEVTNHHRKLSKEAKFYDLRRKAILILAVKSCCDMNESAIKKASILTSIPEETLKDYCSQAKKSLGKKIKRRQNEIELRDKAYFYHKRYQLELENAQNDSHWYDSIAGKYDRKTMQWQAKNNLLKKKEYTLSPTNRSVSKIIGMNERQVSYILKQAEDNVDNLTLKDYYDEYENLLSNRQSEQEKRDE